MYFYLKDILKNTCLVYSKEMLLNNKELSESHKIY